MKGCSANLLGGKETGAIEIRFWSFVWLPNFEKYADFIKVLIMKNRK
jgi:hypothetical protein